MSGGAFQPVAPRATVVIPTYNYSTVLAYAIASVLDQTFRDFELLVVGDACTDDSEQVVAAAGDPRVRWINLPRNTGHQVGPNNEGLRLARGVAVAYLGHDDLWAPGHLGALVAAIEEGAPVAHTRVLNAGPRGPCTAIPETGWTYERGSWIPPTSMAVRRELATRVGGWRRARETGMLDPESDLVARIFDRGEPPVLVPRITCVKLAATARKNVYRDRPSHEQAYWLALIRAADDPEAVLAEQVGTEYHLAGERVAPLALGTRAWRSTRWRLRRVVGLSNAQPAALRIRRSRRFKGLR